MKSSIQIAVLFPAIAVVLAMTTGCGGAATAPVNQVTKGAGISSTPSGGGTETGASGTTSSGTTSSGSTGAGTSTTGTGTSTSTGTTDSGTTGSGTTGSGTTGAGSGTTGSGTTGSGTTGSGTTGSGTTGNGTTGSGTTGTGTATTGSGTTGSGTTGSGTTGGGTTGSGTSGTGTGATGSGTTGSGTTGSGTTGSSTTGSGTTGTGTATTGSGTTGSGTTGSGTTGGGTTGSGTTGTGTGTTGSGTAGSGTTGSGTTGSGTTGSGTTGSGTTGSGTTGSGTTGTDPYPGPVPSNATVVSEIQALAKWQAAYDQGTSGSSGSSAGAMELVDNPSISGQAREFDSTYTDSGGERYYVSIGADTTATNFFYDMWVYLGTSTAKIANLEFDMNQVMANGQTVIYGFQCDGYSHTWDYTENAGTPAVPVDRWVHSPASCNVQNWSVNTWHHLQVSYSRDDEGNVTYNSVWLDSTEQSINATVPSAFALGWGSTLLTNFQVDGLGASGSSAAYLDKMTVYRW
jgi:hypothetical protein